MFVVIIQASLTFEIMGGTTTIMADLPNVDPLTWDGATVIYPRLLLINTIPPECVDQSEEWVGFHYGANLLILRCKTSL